MDCTRPLSLVFLLSLGLLVSMAEVEQGSADASPTSAPSSSPPAARRSAGPGNATRSGQKKLLGKGYGGYYGEEEKGYGGNEGGYGGGGGYESGYGGGYEAGNNYGLGYGGRQQSYGGEQYNNHHHHHPHRSYGQENGYGYGHQHKGQGEYSHGQEYNHNHNNHYENTGYEHHQEDGYGHYHEHGPFHYEHGYSYDTHYCSVHGSFSLALSHHDYGYEHKGYEKSEGYEGKKEEYGVEGYDKKEYNSYYKPRFHTRQYCRYAAAASERSCNFCCRVVARSSNTSPDDIVAAIFAFDPAEPSAHGAGFDHHHHHQSYEKEGHKEYKKERYEGGNKDYGYNDYEYDQGAFQCVCCAPKHHSYNSYYKKK